MDSSPDKNSCKAHLREVALAARDTLSPEQRNGAAQALAAHILPLQWAPQTVVAGFRAIRSEIDPMPLMRMLAEHGAALALPVTQRRGRPLIFRAWAPGAPLVRGRHGTFEPSLDATEVVPDIVLVPLAAFDRAGHRIGYGGGYYDRTLQQLRASKKITAIGIAFAAQEIALVPSSEHDARLDLVLTEREIIDLRGL